jgi:hypothetical protein
MAVKDGVAALAYHPAIQPRGKNLSEKMDPRVKPGGDV